MCRSVKILFLFFVLSSFNVWSQTTNGFGEFYDESFSKERRALTREPLRETDVAWETFIWRIVDFREKFNQFFYYPYEKEGIRGRKNLVYTIWDAVLNNEIPVFEDDEFKKPIDSEMLKKRYTVVDTIWLEIEDDEESYEYKAVVVPKEFSSEYIYQLKIKEVWYHETKTSTLAVQILGIAFVKEDIRFDSEGEADFRGTVTLFWVPFMSQKVQNLLANSYVYRDYNLATLPTWEQIFYTRYFNSFIIREDNRHNTTIADYFVGEDAMKEAERIEDALAEIEMSLWEY